MKLVLDIINGVLLVGAVTMLQLVLHIHSPWVPNLIVPTLIVLAFSMHPSVALAGYGLAVWVYSLLPHYSVESGALLLVVLLAFLLEKKLPWDPSMNVGGVSLLGLLLFYALSFPGGIISNWSVALWSMGVGFIYALVMFLFVTRVYNGDA